MRWRLSYVPTVTTYLYSLRESGHALHSAIKAMQSDSEPWQGARPITERPGRFEKEMVQHWVGFDIIEDTEPTIRVIYIQPIE